LQPSEVVGVKKLVSEKTAEGVNESGLTLTGFLFLHALFIERGHLETTWTVLRKFGYDDEIKLHDELLLSPPFKRMPDQVITDINLFWSVVMFEEVQKQRHLMFSHYWGTG
jgi:Ras family protein T1